MDEGWRGLSKSEAEELADLYDDNGLAVDIILRPDGLWCVVPRGDWVNCFEPDTGGACWPTGRTN